MVTETPHDALAENSTVLVCPTPQGGHIEHAADLAIAISLGGGESTTLLTRAGAKSYLPPGVDSYLCVNELIPPLVSKDRRFVGLRILLNLVVEHCRIRSFLSKNPNLRTLVLEEARYPFPGLLKWGTSIDRICLIKHNAVEHAQTTTSVTDRFRNWIAQSCLRRVDMVAVHGYRQLVSVRGMTPSPVKAFTLPGASYLPRLRGAGTQSSRAEDASVQDAFLCVGEIRPNKGVERAIAAAKLSTCRLIVAGEGIDPSYVSFLREAAGTSDEIEIRPHFLSPAEFDFLLGSSRAVVLSYIHFEAQSGVLARAMALGAEVLASDLPSLREQAGDYPFISFFPPASADALAELMTASSLHRRESHTGKSPGSSELLTAGTHAWEEMALGLRNGW
ncbi:glycosyltransferase [Cryobacterium sp. W22_MBD10_FK3]|uniref:glycosyltransferase n=1 Tax=Cryobacterium sp. W22_MBD10_FK3 TaxID=3240273 RepID=UPI003F9179C7